MNIYIYGHRHELIQQSTTKCYVLSSFHQMDIISIQFVCRLSLNGGKHHHLLSLFDLPRKWESPTFLSISAARLEVRTRDGRFFIAWDATTYPSSIRPHLSMWTKTNRKLWRGRDASNVFGIDSTPRVASPYRGTRQLACDFGGPVKDKWAWTRIWGKLQKKKES